MKISNVINKFNPDLDKNNLDLVDVFYDTYKNLRKENENISQLETLIDREFNKLKNKIKDTELKINTSLFGSKKFINEAYAYEIPLSPEYFIDPDKASFKDNILTTKIVDIKGNNKKPIRLENILSKRNTDLKIVDNIIYINKNEYFNYQEIEFRFPDNDSNGFVYIEFEKYENISILDSYGKELIPKAIINKIRYPVNRDTKSITLRFHNNIDKSIILKEAFLTQNNFELSTEIYSKKISINQTMSQIGINTCDNYSDELSDINYEISLNGNPFRPIRPLNKQKNLHLDSILTTSSIINSYKLEPNTDSLYYDLDVLKSYDFKILNIFKYKLGEDIGLVQQELIYIYLKEDYSIILNNTDIIEIDDTTYIANKDGYEIPLTKGFYKLKVSLDLWNQPLNTLNLKIKKADTNRIIIDSESTEQTRIIKFDKYSKENNSIFFQLIDKADIFLSKENIELNYINNIPTIEKEFNDNLYVYLYYLYNEINTVQLKITLKSLNKDHPVYVSSLTVRGI